MANIYCKVKVKKLMKSSLSIWHLLHNVKLMVKISSIFVTFLENMNFKILTRKMLLGVWSNFNKRWKFWVRLDFLKKFMSLHIQLSTWTIIKVKCRHCVNFLLFHFTAVHFFQAQFLKNKRKTISWKKFCCFFGKFEDTRKKFWNYLTFRWIMNK